MFRDTVVDVFCTQCGEYISKSIRYQVVTTTKRFVMSVPTTITLKLCQHCYDEYVEHQNNVAKPRYIKTDVVKQYP